MKKTLFLFFFLAAITLIGIFFLDVSDLKSENICIVVVESGNDSIKNLPYIKSVLNYVKKECKESEIVIDTGSIFEQKENVAYYFYDVPDNLETYSPAVEFLKNSAFDYTSLSSAIFEMYPEKIKDELKRSGVKTSLFNSSFSGKLKSLSIGGIKVFFANFISDKGFRYYNEKIKEKWSLTSPFQKPQNDSDSFGTDVKSDIGIAIFNDYKEIPFTLDDFSEAVVFFNEVFPALDIIVTDGTGIDEIESFRQSLITVGTEKDPAVIVFKFSVVKNENNETVAVIKKGWETISIKDFKPDETSKKMLTPYIKLYNDFNEERLDLKTEIKCGNPGRSECILDRLYAEALKKSAEECGMDTDFTISYAVNRELNKERGGFVTRGEINSIFSLTERSVAVKLTWEAVVEIMNNQTFRSDNRFLAITPLKYIYSPEGNFLPSTVYKNERKFNVVMPVSLFKKIDDSIEYEDKICLSDQFPFKYLMDTILSQRSNYFKPLWHYDENGK